MQPYAAKDIMKKLTLVVALLFVSACNAGNSDTSVTPKQVVDDFFVSTTASAPVGWQISENKGFYCRFFPYSGTDDYSDRFNGALAEIKEEGKKMGANALINFSVSGTSFEFQGSKWHSSVVHLCGDYVAIK